MKITRLDKYELQEQLGKGGFGTVYKATDTVLGREVAIKILHPQLTVEPDFIERFRNEARKIAAFDHPNISTVYDMGEESGRVFIAMRYLPGGSLRDKLNKESRLDFDSALKIITEVSAGLQVAHAKGMIHRDIKPENILFTADGVAVISDFGLAKAIQASTSSTSSSAGGVGTPSYRAPELWRGQPPASPGTDLYSLACVFVEMLTGKQLFTGDTPDEIITKHLVNGAVLPAKWPEGTPSAIEKIVKKALNKDATRRYSGTEAFAKALVSLSRETRAQFTTRSTRTRVKHTGSRKFVKRSIKNHTTTRERSTPMVMNGISRAISPSLIWVFTIMAIFIAVIILVTYLNLSSGPTQIPLRYTQIASETEPPAAIEPLAEKPTEAPTEDWLAIANNGVLVYGPEDGSLPHNEDEFIETSSANISLRDFVVSSEFFNPYSTEIGSWDYGFLFREEAALSNNQYLLAIASDGTWVLRNSTESDSVEIQSGIINNLNLDTNESNLVELICLDSKGALYINNVFITEIDLSARTNAGDVMIATGIFSGNVISGDSTEFSNFTVKEISDTGAMNPSSGAIVTTYTVETPSAVSSGTSCDNDAVFVSDVTVPDDTRMIAGQSFSKTWRVKNTGSCAWVPGFS